jgi:putative phosphoesterase
MVIGLISDTHGLLRAAALHALAGVDAILHAGDVGGAVVLDGLKTIAPVRAVAGNTDDPSMPGLEAFIDIEALGLTIHVSHGHELGSPTPAKVLAAYTADILVYGHTHRPLVHREANRLVVNPGAAGPRRFDLRPTLARLTIARGAAEAEIVDLPE